MAARNVLLIRRFFDEVVNRGNMVVADELLAETFTNHGSFGASVADRESLKQTLLATLATFSCFTVTVDDMMMDEDRVAVRWTARGTHTGELAGILPTGRQICYGGIGIYRFRRGRIQESWMMADEAGLLRQLRPNIPAINV